LRGLHGGGVGLGIDGGSDAAAEDCPEAGC
jgi:hypothetical protein